MTEIYFEALIWLYEKICSYGVQSFCSHKNRAISTKLKILEFKTVYFICQV